MGDPMSDAWAGELKVLEGLVEHHVGEEESTGFGCARDDFETAELEAMSQEFPSQDSKVSTPALANASTAF
jgi:hypothetical protein